MYMLRIFNVRIAHCLHHRGAGAVCNLVFLSRYMRPEGPWQRLRRCPRATAVAVYMYDLFHGTSTGLAGHSRAPNHQ